MAAGRPRWQWLQNPHALRLRSTDGIAGSTRGDDDGGPLARLGRPLRSALLSPSQACALGVLQARLSGRVGCAQRWDASHRLPFPWLRTPAAGRRGVPAALAFSSQPGASGLVVFVVHWAWAAWATAAFSGCRFGPSPASADAALLRAERPPSPLSGLPTGAASRRPLPPPRPRVVPAVWVLRPRVPRAVHEAVAPAGSAMPPGVSSGSEVPRFVAGAWGESAEVPQ